MGDLSDRLYQDPGLVEFYDIENGAGDDLDYCLEMARQARSVLDLGCGTGQLAAMIADGKRVVGVDPAGSMLEIARNRQGGDKVVWIEASAQSVRLGETFDLIVLTGHAFQVFLTDDDIRSVLATIAVHLAPEGRFIFDSRNPVYEEWRGWTPEESERQVVHLVHGAVRAWNDVAFDPATAVATYQTFYEIPAIGKTISATSQIRFIDRERLSALIDEARLKVERWLGDWQGGGFTEDSKEIIPIGGLR